MKLLVTDGAGYIGSVMTKQLIEAEHEVTILDNFTKGHHHAIHPQVKLVKGKLLDSQQLKEVLNNDFDGVLHFAALALVQEDRNLSVVR